ncbi:MAG: O-antigen ligase family protein [Bryobacteraceae bacterium]
MTPPAAALVSLLFFGILTLWVPQLWAWSLFQVGIFLLAAVRFLRKRPVWPRSAGLPLAAAALWPLLQLALAQTVNRGATWVAALNWFTFLLVFLLACDALAHLRARDWFLKTSALCGSLLAVLAIAQKYSANGRIFWLFPSGYTTDVLGPFVNRNQYAAWMELLLPIALYFAVTDRRTRVLYGTGSAIMLSSVIAAGSRAGSVLVLAEGLAVMAIFAFRAQAPRRTIVLRALQFSGAVVIAVALAGSNDLRARLQATGAESLRLDALQASIRMTAERPWMGSGLGTWSIIYPKYARIDTGLFMNQAHNDWAQWAAEGGIPFVGLLALFAAALAKPAFRSIYGLGIAAFLLHALLDYPMQQRPGLAAFFFAIAGAAAANEAANGSKTISSCA